MSLKPAGATSNGSRRRLTRCDCSLAKNHPGTIKVCATRVCPDDPSHTTRSLSRSAILPTSCHSDCGMLWASRTTRLRRSRRRTSRAREPIRPRCQEPIRFQFRRTRAYVRSHSAPGTDPLARDSTDTLVLIPRLIPVDTAEQVQARQLEEFVRDFKAARKVYHKRALWSERWGRGEVAWQED